MRRRIPTHNAYGDAAVHVESWFTGLTFTRLNRSAGQPLSSAVGPYVSSPLQRG